MLEAASLDPERFEVIVRDNSENSAKRALLSSVNAPAMRFVSVSNRGAFENFTEALRLATGDFVYLLGDDDWFFARGLDQLHTHLEGLRENITYSAGTGDYLIETSTHTGIVRYPGLDSEVPEERLTAYLQARVPNVLYYAAVRRDLVQRCYEFLEGIPYKLSFHDQLVSLMYLAAGRVASIQRVVYVYDLGTWETAEGTLSKDRSTYREAGLPIEVDRLHWLICGMEGAILLRSTFLSDLRFDRPRMADIWFGTNFARFKQLARDSGYGDNPANEATRRLRDKWGRPSDVNLNELLLDVCDIFELVDKRGAERYFRYWSTL